MDDGARNKPVLAASELNLNMCSSWNHKNQCEKVLFGNNNKNTIFYDEIDFSIELNKPKASSVSSLSE